VKRQTTNTLGKGDTQKEKDYLLKHISNMNAHLTVRRRGIDEIKKGEKWTQQNRAGERQRVN